jgi:hypothetical protein
MLAYVSWHWRRADVDASVYVENLIRFHETLNQNKPHGFSSSVVFQVGRVPWVKTSHEVFEEWYVLESSAILDSLNEAAVSGDCLGPHNEVAQLAAGGVGGLYRLRRGRPNFGTCEYVVWFSKPDGMPYEALEEQAFLSTSGACVWGRQMGLGPAPEFCFFSEADVGAPDEFELLRVRSKIVWCA